VLTRCVLPIAASAWDSGSKPSSGKGGGSSSSSSLPAAPPADEPEDTNDDFCFKCGSSGELILCDRCDRSYHLHCVDPPLDVAPEGEWACPAHSQGKRKKKTEAELLAEANQSHENAERGMPRKPARVDATKYQIAPTMLRAERDPAEKPLAVGAGSLAWVPEGCAEEALCELLAFAHRLVESATLSDAFFAEYLMTHLHLSGYSLPRAKATLLLAKQWLGALPDESAAQLQALGHAAGEALLAVVGAAHASAFVLLPNVLAPGIADAVSGTLPTSLAALGRGSEDEAAAAALVETHERQQAEAVRVAVSEWSAQVDALLGSSQGAQVGEAQPSAAEPGAEPGAGAGAAPAVPDDEPQGSLRSQSQSHSRGGAVLKIKELEKLVHDGAAAHKLGRSVKQLREAHGLPDRGADLNRHILKYLGSTGSTGRLAMLSEALQHGASWQARCAEQLARPQTTEGLQALLAEGERIPLRLAEVEEVRGRLRRVDAWLAGTREAMLKASCELRELQDLQREAEALRIKVPEADVLRDRTAACKKWMTTVNNELLRRTSSRKASGARLSVAVVEGLLGEAATLRLDAVEITQVRDRLDMARKWSEDARALLVPPVPVTPTVLKLLDELSTGAEELNLNLAEQEVLDGRLGTVRGWLQRAKAAMESNAEWQVSATDDRS
jgi:hypothetical protein